MCAMTKPCSLRSMEQRDTVAGERFCELQARLEVEELCSGDCLYFERSGSPVVGCLYKTVDVSAIPTPIARQLLKSAGRRYR